MMPRILTIKINQGTKFGTLEKPMFSFFDVISFLFNGKIEQNIKGTTSNNSIYEIVAPGYFSRNTVYRLLHL